MAQRPPPSFPLWHTNYLSTRAIEGLKSYQYKSGGLTWLDHLHNPLWNACVARLPMWLAPNLITLAGTMWVVAAWLLSLFLRPEFVGEPCPTWCYIFFAAAVVIYVNLDCMDGKQARRTGSSSPLGQLFDHGCDALSLHLLLDTVRTSLQLPAGPGATAMEMAIMVPWMLAHWEEYHTGLMLYGNGWVGVLEGNYALVVIHLVTAALGPSVWDTRVIPWDLPAPLQPITTLRYAMLSYVAVMAAWSAAGQLHRVLVFPTASLAGKEKGAKQLGNGAGFLHLTYLCVLCVLGWAYLTTPPPPPSAYAAGLAASNATAAAASGSASPAQQVLSAGQAGLLRAALLVHDDLGMSAYHTRVVGATWGLVYALIASQLIMAHMCKEPFTPYLWALSVLAAGCINMQLHLAPVLLVDLLLLAVAFIGYCHFVSCIINQICAALGISCLTIKRAPKPAESKQ